MAELLRGQGRGQDRDCRGPQLWDGADGGDVQPLRRASGTRLQRRPQSDGTALLHELGLVEVREAREISTHRGCDAYQVLCPCSIQPPLLAQGEGWREVLHFAHDSLKVPLFRATRL